MVLSDITSLDDLMNNSTRPFRVSQSNYLSQIGLLALAMKDRLSED